MSCDRNPHLFTFRSRSENHGGAYLLPSNRKNRPKWLAKFSLSTFFILSLCNYITVNSMDFENDGFWQWYRAILLKIIPWDIVKCFLTINVESKLTPQRTFVFLLLLLRDTKGWCWWWCCCVYRKKRKLHPFEIHCCVSLPQLLYPDEHFACHPPSFS